MDFQRNQSISLAGTWSCRLDPEHRGLLENWKDDPRQEHTVTLPGTTQTNGIGRPFDKRLISSLTNVTDHVGPAWYWREIELAVENCAMHVELFLERCCWQTYVWLNGTPLGTQDSLVAPHIYNLSKAARPGTNVLVIMVDNSNIRERVPASASDGSQSEDLVLDGDANKRLNCGGHHTVFGGFAWNGVTGRLELRFRPQVRIADLQVHPVVDGKKIRLVLTCTNDDESSCQAMVSFAAGTLQTRTRERSATIKLECEPGEHRITHELDLGDEMTLWDEFSTGLYELTTTLSTAHGSDRQSTTFGMRELTQKGTQMAINGRATFLRGALENFVHPVTGYPPTDVDYWLRIFGVNKAHGLNHVRFHTCCPPDAAFCAADQLGIILNIELPGCSGSEPDDPDTLKYLQQEALRILRTFGNHPSFCMLTMGNELLYGGEDADSQAVLMKRVAICREEDGRHWYCCTAHPHTEGRDDDFYVSAWPKGATWECNGEPITGIRWSGFDVVDSSRFNTRPPETASDYREGIAGIEKPVITHEVGQWAVYPDIEESPKFNGVQKAFNLDIIRQFMEEKGTLALAGDFVRASAQLSLLLYKEEIESALRTPGLAGFQLLGFHDHPPQGTSTVGIVTALREPKGIVSPEQFREFCGEIVPLARLTKRTFILGETVSADIDVAHWGQEDLAGAAFGWRLMNALDSVVIEGLMEPMDIPHCSLSRLGTIEIQLSSLTVPTKARLEVFLEGSTIANGWDLWIYPEPDSREQTDVMWSRTWNTELAAAVEGGATLVLELTTKQIPHATRGCFTTVFWNPIMKRNQLSFTMGVLCDPMHPALAEFPTEYHTNWQWWDVLRPSRVLDLDCMMPRPTSIVRMIDSFIGNRSLSVLFEARLGKGRILVTSLDLSSELTHRHAARQLRHSICAYVGSDSFAPDVEIAADDIDMLLSAHQEEQIRETRDEVRERFDRPR